jgi:hypothetical protein
MTTESKRDLYADLALCEAAENASPGKWFVMHGKDVCAEFPPGSGELDTIANSYTVGIPEYIAESREAWPEAIRRAIVAESRLKEAEAEIDRLRSVLYRFDDRRNAMMPRSQMARIAKEALDASPGEYVDITESHRWLKALVSALDDGRIQQTRLSSGTDYVILGAREHVRKLSTEVVADVGL